jgi:hypothetical protein
VIAGVRTVITIRIGAEQPKAARAYLLFEVLEMPIKIQLKIDSFANPFALHFYDSAHYRANT